MKHPCLFSNQGVTPVVMSSHNGLGAYPPALPQALMKPFGMALGSRGEYREFVPRADAWDTMMFGTSRSSCCFLFGSVWVGALSTDWFQLRTMLAIEKEDATDTVASIRRVKKQTLHFAIVLLIKLLGGRPNAYCITNQWTPLAFSIVGAAWGLWQSAVAQRRHYYFAACCCQRFNGLWWQMFVRQMQVETWCCGGAVRASEGEVNRGRERRKKKGTQMRFLYLSIVQCFSFFFIHTLIHH